MPPIFPQPGAAAPVSLPVPARWLRDRITRLAALGPQDTTAGLLWLAMNFPAVCDAMLDKLECDDIDDIDDIDDDCASQEPEPFCAECGAHIGIFLRFGLDWRHYHGDGTIIGQIELFDPGHDPVVAWRLTPVPAT